jgi:hypothetical protein
MNLTLVQTRDPLNFQTEKDLKTHSQAVHNGVKP